ncbi:MAG: hypothetical protein J5772_09025 [Clostridia bacterium]|nr:hypothetical protein [Clostridia bacterium]
MNPTVAIVLGTIFGIIGAVAVCIFIMPESKREQLKNSKFLLFLHDAVNFKSLLIEKFLKILYVVCTCVCILTGFFMLFSKAYGTSLALRGLGMMILGPIAIRIAYELVMLLIIGVKNIIQINNKIEGDSDASEITISSAENKAE